MLNGVDPFGSDEGHGDRNLMNFIADNYWSESEQNWDAEYPRLGLTKVQVANNMVPSTYWMRNGNFIRFKTLEIGYSFPHCRVFCQWRQPGGVESVQVLGPGTLLQFLSVTAYG